MKLLLSSIATNIIEASLPLFSKQPIDTKITYIPTAAYAEGGDISWFHDEIEKFNSLGFQMNEFDINGASELEVREALKNQDGVLVCGGNTYILLEKMKACNFKNILIEKFKEDFVYIGSSAGSIACSPDIDFIEALDDPSTANLDNTSALNFIDFRLMPHMDHPKFAQEAIRKVEELQNQNIAVQSLKDNEAFYIENSEIKKIIAA